MTSKIVLIGLDGADWQILGPYLSGNVMRNLARLIETGISGPLRSTIPTHSYVAWPTFMTGQNPGRHGVFDFMERSPRDYLRMVTASSRSIQSETFFHLLGQHNRQVGIVNVPLTYPPSPVNGFLVSGIVIPEGATFTFPESLGQELAEQVGGYPINSMEWYLMLDNLEGLIDETISLTRQRAKALRYLIEHKPWDVFAQVFVGLDRLQHPLMNILDPRHPRHDKALAQKLAPKLRAYFETIDETLGDVWDLVRDDAILMIFSDHGFHSCDKLINLERILKREKLLTYRTLWPWRQRARELLLPVLKPIRSGLTHLRSIVGSPGNAEDSGRDVGSPMQMAGIDWKKTRAYVTTGTSEGIFINLAGREPQGTVAQGSEYEAVLVELETILLDLRDSANDRPLIDRIERASNLYSGPWTTAAPDLLLLPSAGYYFSDEPAQGLSPSGHYTGAHRLEGVFVASGAGLRQGDKVAGATLMDLAPTVLYLSGIPIPDDMDGQVLDLFADERLATHPPVYTQRQPSSKKLDYIHTPEEERQIEERLRSLGYL